MAVMPTTYPRQSPDLVDPDGIAEFRPGMQQGSERSVASPGRHLAGSPLQLRQIGATSVCLPPPRGIRCKAFSWVGLREVRNRGEGKPEPAAEEGQGPPAPPRGAGSESRVVAGPGQGSVTARARRDGGVRGGGRGLPG